MSQLDPLKPIPHEHHVYPKDKHVKGSTKSGRVKLISKVGEGGKLAHAHKSHKVALEKHELAKPKAASRSNMYDRLFKHGVKDDSISHAAHKTLSNADYHTKQLKKIIKEVRGANGFISAPNIRELLKTEQGAKALATWAQSSFNVENVDFLKATAKFREAIAAFDTLLQSEHIADDLLEKEFAEIVKLHNSIIETHTLENSPKEINVSSVMRSEVQEVFTPDPHRVKDASYHKEVNSKLAKKFDDAENEVSILLSTSNFAKSKPYADLAKVFGK